MSKTILEETKRQFVLWASSLPDHVWYELVTTKLDDKTELAQLRKLMIKTLNNANHRKIEATL